MTTALTCWGCGAPATHRLPSGRALCGSCVGSGGQTRRPRPRFDPTRPHALAVIPEGCPECHGLVVVSVVRQDALFFHGGFGATQRVERRACAVCRWVGEPLVAEERPPRLTRRTSGYGTRMEG